MRLMLLIAVTMVAFAANSILNRVAVDSGAIDSGSFAWVRVLSGAVMLVALATWQQRGVPLLAKGRLIGAGSLTLYMVAFSLAYLTLDAGLGALLAFGAVQITIFVLTALRGAPATARQLSGSALAFAGLTWVLWPGADMTVDLTGAVLMIGAGIGWGIYTLAGRGEPDALAGTAANFCLALPLTVLATWLFAGPPEITGTGLALAVLSGAITSGLGYALWYAIVPQLAPATAAIVMLSVPVIALVGGVALLGEVASARLLLGSALVIGGIAWAVWSPRPA